MSSFIGEARHSHHYPWAGCEARLPAPPLLRRRNNRRAEYWLLVVLNLVRNAVEATDRSERREVVISTTPTVDVLREQRRKQLELRLMLGLGRLGASDLVSRYQTVRPGRPTSSATIGEMR
jgi:hypothetical protein